MSEPRDLQTAITEYLDAATEHLAAADALALDRATRGGSEQIARLLAAAANASIAGTLMVTSMRETLGDLRADLAALADTEPEHEDDGLDVDGLPRIDWGDQADREHDRWRDEQAGLT